MLSVTEHNPDRRRTIVWLHGAGVTGWLWDAQVTALAEDHHLVLDLPGHGASHELPWTSLDATADLVAEVIRAQAHGVTAVVVGLSLGGDVGLRLLERYPLLVQCAVLTGMVATPVGGVLLWIQRAAAPMASWTIFHAAAATSMGLSGQRRRQYIDTVPRMRSDDYRSIVTEVLRGVPLTALEAVTVPTLALAGAKEPRVARQSAQLIAATMPGATARIVPGVGHTWNVEAPELFSQTVRDWMREHP